MKRWQKNLIWFGWYFLLVVAFEITDYFVENNLLGTFYVFLIEIMFLGLGASCVFLEYKLKEKGSKK
ncbi:MAG: hypothetical protein IJV03_01885 [Alphaproteobacteria bacterium]|nr:hypothetical protein [Alphaproteobacteria bacterium]